MPRTFSTALLIAITLLSAACGGKDPSSFSGKQYPPTTQVATAFQHTQVPKPCRVFAELLVELPQNLSGKEIQETIFKEAKAKGADLILLGQTRQREDDSEVNFIYYGPRAEYICSTSWCGWKFGFDEWEDQGDWVDIGISEWGNNSILFEYPLMTQVAFLRCR